MRSLIMSHRHPLKYAAAVASNVRINVYVQPSASRTEISGRHGTDLKIRLRSPPVEDAANEELIAFVAHRLGIPRRQVRLVAGARNRRKTLEVTDAPTDVLAALCGIGDEK